MDMAQLQQLYDFTESDFLGLSVGDGTQVLTLSLDYYWNLGREGQPGSLGPSQPIRVVFTACRKVLVLNDRGYLDSGGSGGVPQTVISWGDATSVELFRDHCSDLDTGEMAINFQVAGPGGDSRIMVVCRDVLVEQE